MMADRTPRTEKVVRDFIAWENGDESKRDVVSESLDMYNPGLPEGEVHDRKKWAEYMRESREAFPDLHFAIEEVISSGDVAAVEVNITGTHKAEFKGIPPTGREVDFRGMSRYVVVDGKVEEGYTYYDTQELPNQLGLTFPAVIGQLPKLAWRKLRTSL
jgi:steroid delta-isomerase-like uncharacterized protein